MCLGASTFVQLTGKGRKERTIPLWPSTSQVLKAWFAELGAPADRIAFPRAKGAESIETTHVYLETDLATKAKALEKLEPIAGVWKRFRANDSLPAFLASL